MGSRVVFGPDICTDQIRGYRGNVYFVRDFPLAGNDLVLLSQRFIACGSSADCHGEELCNISGNYRRKGIALKNSRSQKE